jgi:hypothetical protein
VLPSGLITYADISPTAILASQAIVHGQVYESFRDFVVPIFLGLTTASVGLAGARIANRSYRLGQQTLALNSETVSLNKATAELTRSLQAAQSAKEKRSERETVAQKVNEFARLATGEISELGYLLIAGQILGRAAALETLDEARFMAEFMETPNGLEMLDDVTSCWIMNLKSSARPTRVQASHRARMKSLGAMSEWVARPETYMDRREAVLAFEPVSDQLIPE